MLSEVALMVALAAAPGERELVDRIVAIVNDDVVVMSEVESANEQTLGLAGTASDREVLEQLINERLMTQQIQAANIDVTEDELNRAIQDILRTNNIQMAELQAAVETRGLSMGQYREDLKAQLVQLKLVDMKVRSRVVIPESEIKAEFERRTRDEPREQLLKISHIFLRWGESPDPGERARVLKAARTALKRLKNGANFEKLAKEISQGPTAASGGDLGELTRQQMLPALAKGTKGLKAGELSEPIETSSGVHVVLVKEVTEKAGKTYTEMRSQIYSELYQREVQAQMKVWLEELRKQAAVSILL